MSMSYAIRKWAFNHARLAQGLIVVSTVVLFFLGHVLGVLFEELGWDSYAMFLIGTGAALLAWTLAPRKEENFPIRYTYARQKVAIIILLISTCLGVGGWAICLEGFGLIRNVETNMHRTEAAIRPNFSQDSKVFEKFEGALIDWFHGGISKRVLKTTRTLKDRITPKSTILGQALATIGALLLLALLTYLLLVLSCSIACSGAEVLAILVLVGGMALIVIFATRLFRKIFKKKVQLQ